MGRNRRKRRDVFPSRANRRLPLSRSPLSVFSGPRLYSFDKDYVSLKSRAAEPIRSARKRSLFSKLRSAYYVSRTFADPSNLVNGLKSPVTRLQVCASRQMRKEVLHALGHAGRGGQKRPRWTAKSRIKCGG